MNVEELQNSLEAHEQTVLERKNNNKVAEQALQARTNHKSRGRGGWTKSGRGRKREGNSFISQDGKRPIDKRKIQCYNCDKFGHFAHEC
ncbi:hypothetical protein glysoja_043545, partial [Glycine soja]